MGLFHQSPDFWNCQMDPSVLRSAQTLIHPEGGGFKLAQCLGLLKDLSRLRIHMLLLIHVQPDVSCSESRFIDEIVPLALLGTN